MIKYIKQLFAAKKKLEAQKKATIFCLDFIESVHRDNAKVSFVDYCHVLNVVGSIERSTDD